VLPRPRMILTSKFQTVMDDIISLCENVGLKMEGGLHMKHEASISLQNQKLKIGIAAFNQQYFDSSCAVLFLLLCSHC